MKVTLAKFCDHACTVDGGKGSLIGMFNTIGGAQFPLVHPTFFICVELEFEQHEAHQQKTVKMTLIDEDGKELLGVEGQMQVPPPHGIRPATIFQTFKIDNFTFPRPGHYRLDILDGGHPISEARLYLEQAQAAPQG